MCRPRKRPAEATEQNQSLPTLSYEELDVMRMELPPGWRGYGAKDYIDHPDTLRRQQQVDEMQQAMDGKDRHTRQEALMPFRHLLPAHLRGNNQRLGDEE